MTELLPQSAALSMQSRVADRLIRVLTLDGQSYCTSCISMALKLPAEVVAHETEALAGEGLVKRALGSCMQCGDTTLLTQRCISAFAA
jgi:hypothetical protein